MDVSSDTNHITNKGWKFGFHKRLANGVNRWVCTKYKCNAYIKTGGPENNVIFENLTHRHGGVKDVSVESNTKDGVNHDDNINFQFVPVETSFNMNRLVEEPIQTLNTSNIESLHGESAQSNEFIEKYTPIEKIKYPAERSTSNTKGEYYMDDEQSMSTDNISDDQSLNLKRKLVSRKKSSGYATGNLKKCRRGISNHLQGKSDTFLSELERKALEEDDYLQNIDFEQVSSSDESESSLEYNKGREYDTDGNLDPNVLVKKLYLLNKLKKLYPLRFCIYPEIARIEHILRQEGIIH